jgi:hypothetical protein
VEQEFEAYLTCGRLEHGFLRVRCRPATRSGWWPSFPIAAVLFWLSQRMENLRDRVGE